MILCYDGTHYSGWQIQPNALSIQEIIQKTLHTITQNATTVIASGRTDAGVHAYEQVTHFYCEKDLDLKKTVYSLNGLLPPDIRVLSLEKAPKGFHARFSAKAKIYRYHLHLNHIHTPFKKPYSLHIRKTLNVDLIKQGAKYLIGTHNFKSFANKAETGSAKTSPIKTIYRLDLIQESSHDYYFEIHGNGFLYKMVRNIVGTLIDCGLKKISPEDVKTILLAQNRKKASSAAPPHALFLTKIFYNSF